MGWQTSDALNRRLPVYIESKVVFYVDVVSTSSLPFGKCKPLAPICKQSTQKRLAS